MRFKVGDVTHAEGNSFLRFIVDTMTDRYYYKYPQIPDYSSIFIWDSTELDELTNLYTDIFQEETP